MVGTGKGKPGKYEGRSKKYIYKNKEKKRRKRLERWEKVR